MFDFLKNSKVQFVIGMVALVLIIWAMLPASEAQAQYSHARADTVVAGGAKVLMAIQTKVHVNGNGVSASDLPSAYLLFAGDGASFWVTRYDGATSEMEADIKVPANSSLTLPAPPALRLFNQDGNGEYRYYHLIYLNATAVGDSLFCIPLD